MALGEEAIVENGAAAHHSGDTTALDPSARDSGSSRLGRLPVRAIVTLAFVALVVWYMFILDTRANNDVIEGFRTLFRGIGELPGMAVDGDAYAAWWTYVSDQEGWDNVARRTLQHVQLVAASMLFAGIISIALGILVHRVRALRGAVLGIASIMLTIPSLALFAIFISVPGIGVGDRGPIIALAMYSVLPILRNTVIGLEDVDRAVIESAKGMGLNRWQRLFRIELPLAWPVVLTGIRIATLLNIGIAAIAPLVGGTGLGGYVRDGLQRFPEFTAVERMWTGVIMTILLALVADLIFALVRRLTTSKGLRS